MQIPATETPLDAYTSLGSYPIAYYAADCEPICPSCANGGDFHVGCQTDFTRAGCLADDSQFCLVACDVLWEGPPEQCSHCGEDIETAYGDPDADDDEEGHTDYPHEPGYLLDCPACEASCHCGAEELGRPRIEGHTLCVWDGHNCPDCTNVSPKPSPCPTCDDKGQVPKEYA